MADGGRELPKERSRNASATGISTPSSTGSVVSRFEAEPLPTNSHALADESIHVDSGTKGASQHEHQDAAVKDVGGWNGGSVPQPVVGGLSNDDLWTMTRRFNKQIFHVRKIKEPPLAGLDLNIADDEQFSPQKMRAQLERLYMVVLISLFSAFKHVARLRSWKEWKRTSGFLLVYASAWYFDLLTPTLIAFLMVLVLSPSSRPIFFPPAPLSLIDPKTGGIQKPPAGVLASDDSATGAPEKHKGEALEQEAHSFVTSIASVCSGLVTSTAAGKRPRADPYEDTSVPDPTEVTADVAYARDRTDGDDPTVINDKTREPVSRAVWDMAKPAMHILAQLLDIWERFGNALSPVTPFPRHRPRLILASCLVPLFMIFYFATYHIIFKSLGFLIGFAFFGGPVISYIIAQLNRVDPQWTTHLRLEHNVLRGIPTNVQLVVTLLRIGERAKSPIPPPPTTLAPPRMEPHATAGQDLDHLGVSQEEIENAVNPDIGDEDKEPLDKKYKWSKRIMNFLRGTARGGIQTAMAVDRARALARQGHARNRLGVIRKVPELSRAGPATFPARYRGKKGYARVTTRPWTPAISWSMDPEGADPAWTVEVANIMELQKVGGLGWKSKIAVGWAMGAEVLDGLVVRSRQGEELHMTAVTMRDELFNRLMAMDNQMWEAW